MSRSTAPFKCPLCDRGTVAVTMIPYPVAFRGKEYLVPDAEVMVCDHCGEVLFAAGQSDALQRRASDMARREMGLLTGAEIAAFRKQHGLTQARLEHVLGASPKTVARWEIGTVLQSRIDDRFLRVLMSCPELLEELPMLADGEITVAASSLGTSSEYAYPQIPQPEEENVHGSHKLALAA